jgi:hypothetical protein
MTGRGERVRSAPPGVRDWWSGPSPNQHRCEPASRAPRIHYAAHLVNVPSHRLQRHRWTKPRRVFIKEWRMSWARSPGRTEEHSGRGQRRGGWFMVAELRGYAGRRGAVTRLASRVTSVATHASNRSWSEGTTANEQPTPYPGWVSSADFGDSRADRCARSEARAAGPSCAAGPFYASLFALANVASYVLPTEWLCAASPVAREPTG